jgi:histidinol phosphatase-like enzyme
MEQNIPRSTFSKIEKSNLIYPQKAIFIDRDGTINKEIHHLNHLDKFELLPRVASAIKLFNESDYLSCIITNQPVVARGGCSLTDLAQIHNKMETLITSTQLMIVPGYTFRLCNGLVTNFHQPKSTLLLIIAAITGAQWKKIYKYAIEQHYRFLSYGDGSLFWIN